jgi:hypothetical protein
MSERLRSVITLGLLFFSVFFVFKVWNAEPPTALELAKDRKLYLCHLAEACKKYDRVRLECATAGNFGTCLRIKMGDDAEYSGLCSNGAEGAPAAPPPPQTPNMVGCFIVYLAHVFR